MNHTLRSLVVAMCAMCIPVSVARSQRMAVVGGLTFSQLRGLGDVQAENRSGTLFGLSFTVPIGSRWSLQPEALFITKGGRFGATSVTAGDKDIRLDYLEIPVLVRRNLLDMTVLVPHVYAGPTVGFNVNCAIKFSGSGIPKTSSDCDGGDFKPKKLDWGAAVGAGVDLDAGGFGITLGARYGIGVANIADDNGNEFSDRVHNGTLAVYAGVRFGR